MRGEEGMVREGRARARAGVCGGCEGGKCERGPLRGEGGDGRSARGRGRLDAGGSVVRAGGLLAWAA